MEKLELYLENLEELKSEIEKRINYLSNKIEEKNYNKEKPKMKIKVRKDYLHRK